MAITISGENNNDRILAQDGVIDSISGFNIAGIITASSFTGDLTGDVTGDLTGNVTGNINNTTLLLQTGGSERVRIDSNGKVGVGVNPSAYPGKFVVSGDALICDRDIHSRVANSVANSDRGFKQDTDGVEKLHLYADNSSHIILEGNNGVEKLRIQSNGNVGVGTNNVSTRLEIEGPTALTNHNQTLLVRDSVSDNATGRGGNIGFGAYVDGTMRSLAGIGAVKSNSGTGFDGHLALYARRNGVGPLDERMRIESGGDIDIKAGVIKLASGANRRLMYRSGNNDVILEADSGDFYRQDIANSTHEFFTGNIERLHITSGGLLGIGTDNPQDTLDISRHSNHGIILRRPAGLSNPGQISLRCQSYGVAEFRSNRHMNLHFDDDNSNNQFFRIYSDNTEVFNISSAGVLNIPAGIGPQLRFENQHSVTTDAAISTYDDAAGTLLCLGSNFYFNSSGSETRYNTGEESSAIVMNRNGTITLKTGGTGATAITRLGIDSDGAVILKNTSAANSRSDFLGSLKPISQIASTWNAYHSITRHDAGSSYGPYLMLAKNRNDAYNSNGVVQDNDELGNIAFLGNDGSVFREGARIRGEIDGTPASNQMPTALGFWTNAGGGLSERLRIERDGTLTLKNNSGMMIDLQSSAANGSTWIEFSDTDGTRKGYLGYGSSGNNKLYLVQQKSDNIELYSNNSTRFLIQSDGMKRVQNGNLNIYETYISFSGSISTPATAAAIYRPADNQLAFSTANNQRALITNTNISLEQNIRLLCKPNSTWSAGVVFGGNGYGGSSTNGSCAVTNGNFHIDARSGSYGMYLNWYAGGNGTYFGNGGGSQRGRIDGAGNLTLSGTYPGSDLRLKENIQNISGATDTIKSLVGKTFTWKAESGLDSYKHYGFIAQEVQKVVPDLVKAIGCHYFDKDDNLIDNIDPTESDEERESKGLTKSLTVNSEGVTPILVEAMKELIAKVETLEAEVATLKGS